MPKIICIDDEPESLRRIQLACKEANCAQSLCLIAFGKAEQWENAPNLETLDPAPQIVENAEAVAAYISKASESDPVLVLLDCALDTKGGDITKDSFQAQGGAGYSLLAQLKQSATQNPIRIGLHSSTNLEDDIMPNVSKISSKNFKIGTMLNLKSSRIKSEPDLLKNVLLEQLRKLKDMGKIETECVNDFFAQIRQCSDHDFTGQKISDIPPTLKCLLMLMGENTDAPVSDSIKRLLSYLFPLTLDNNAEPDWNSWKFLDSDFIPEILKLFTLDREKNTLSAVSPLFFYLLSWASVRRRYPEHRTKLDSYFGKHWHGLMNSWHQNESWDKMKWYLKNQSCLWTAPWESVVKIARSYYHACYVFSGAEGSDSANQIDFASLECSATRIVIPFNLMPKSCANSICDLADESFSFLLGVSPAEGGPNAGNYTPRHSNLRALLATEFYFSQLGRGNGNPPHYIFSGRNYDGRLSLSFLHRNIFK
jgi:CheY-like chemotaxis protein